MTNFLDDTTKYVNKALKFSDLSDDLSKKIIICNSTYTVRFGVRLRGKFILLKVCVQCIQNIWNQQKAALGLICIQTLKK